MKIQYPILQSGFICFSDKGLAKSPQPTEENFIKAVELGKPFDKNGNPFFFDPEIDRLIRIFENENKKVRSFEFREEFLVAIKNAFKCNKLSDWVLEQKFSPYYSSIHNRFIEDTIRFISKGEREVSIDSWKGIIYPRAATQADLNIPYSDEMKYYLKEYNPTLNVVFSEWTSRVGGWEDLFTTVGIIFSGLTERSV